MLLEILSAIMREFMVTFGADDEVDYNARPQIQHPSRKLIKLFTNSLNKTKMSYRNFLPSAPGKLLWILAVIIGGIGVLTHYYHIDTLSTYNYEMLLIGFVLLVIGTTYRRV